MFSSIDINTVHDIRTSLHSKARVRDVLELLAKKATEALKAKGALVRLLDMEAERLGPAAAHGLDKRYLAHELLSNQETIRNFYQDNKIIIINDIMHDPRVGHPREAWGEGIRMMVDVPLRIGGQITGIVRVYLAEHREFSREELNFLVTCATCGACAVEKAREIEAQKSQYDHLALQTEKLSALGRMAAGIAHEINNPLAGILLYSTNLMKKAPKDGPLREGLDVIIYETKRCGNIIQELLEFSREGEPDKTSICINEIVEKALSILENEFRLHHIEVEKQLSPEMPEILVDANQMEQVFVNLLLNAVEAIQEHGQIVIQTRMGASRETEVIAISDTGCGIPAENISRIFEPFYSNKTNGTGLGLSVSYGIIQKHNGNIWVQSGLGEGTRFTIELPLQQAILGAPD
jgi:signal transduction histidine kinase